MNNQKGQILLVVFMLLIFTGIIVGGLAFLWQSAVNTTALEKESLRAFYIAQAGIERARAEIAFAAEDNFGPTYTNQGFGGGSYDLVITANFNGNANTKEVVSTGRYRNATREIKMRIGVPPTFPGPPYGNAWGWHTKNDDAWEEQ